MTMLCINDRTHPIQLETPPDRHLASWSVSGNLSCMYSRNIYAGGS